MRRRSFLGFLGLAPIGAALPKAALASRPTPALSPQHFGPARLRTEADAHGFVHLNITAFPEGVATVTLRRDGKPVLVAPASFYMHRDGGVHGAPTFLFYCDTPGPGSYLYEAECTNGRATLGLGL